MGSDSDQGKDANHDGRRSDPDADDRARRFLDAYPTDPCDRVAGERAFRKLSAAEQARAIEWIDRYLADCRAKGRKIRSPQAYVRDRVFDGYAAAPPSARPDNAVAQMPRNSVHVKHGTPQWEAWLRARGGRSIPIDSQGGWYFPSEWPPDAEPKGEPRARGSPPSRDPPRVQLLPDLPAAE